MTDTLTGEGLIRQVIVAADGAGVSRQELAKRSGLSLGTIHPVLRGEYLPGLARFVGLARAVGLAVVLVPDEPGRTAISAPLEDEEDEL